MTIRTFRDPSAWPKSMELARSFSMHTNDMPRDECFGWRSRMRRAAVSIPSNIAEDNARHSTPDDLKHRCLAPGTRRHSILNLTGSHLAVFLPDRGLLDVLQEADRILRGLITSIERKLEDVSARPRARSD